ncbi:MAG: GntR family transcriptional regulator [Planctomycetes bacterium]|nr:GntR family transcriptional regulator [Planctomycetota bacterium]
MDELVWNVDPNADAPPSKQLVLRVLDALASDRLAAGAQLPSVRQLAARALVNPNTAARAYRDLEQLGVVRGANGLGVFATEAGPRLARDLRRRSTLDAFRGAASEALRAGHAPSELVTELSKLASNAKRPRKSA